MTTTVGPYAKIARDGLWTNNPGFVQLLGLCPLLAVSNNLVNALALGLATMFVLTMSNTIVSLIRPVVRQEIRIPIYVMVIAALVTIVELVMNAWFNTLYNILGIFLPIITTNCVIIGRAEAYAAKNPVNRAAFDGLMMGAGFGLALVLLGGMRELLAQGTLGTDLHLLFGEALRGVHLTVIPDYQGLLLAALPPGAFIGLGLLIAGKNWIDRRYAARTAAPSPAPAAA
ncbi:electron transport complex subunit E [Sinimarinibacterium flocculans]|uniref:Ion-translocating oxidoreductase complex subunit E n=1 Tax=Sinimarinibacterium flocculans TaxID=985250 RepID=A0A318E994_9GAMM|nr:electron transport complex subunit E [Sinimarinibacterium flocculans]PXV67868.1 electron transport complex protein RnfE [Sinimarinibacterium flocculans]